MVGVVGSSPIAPTKIGRKIRHLAETLGAFFIRRAQKFFPNSQVLPTLLRGSRCATATPAGSASGDHRHRFAVDIGLVACAPGVSCLSRSARVRRRLLILRRAQVHRVCVGADPFPEGRNANGEQAVAPLVGYLVGIDGPQLPCPCLRIVAAPKPHRNVRLRRRRKTGVPRHAGDQAGSVRTTKTGGVHASGVTLIVLRRSYTVRMVCGFLCVFGSRFCSSISDTYSARRSWARNQRAESLPSGA